MSPLFRSAMVLMISLACACESGTASLGSGKCVAGQMRVRECGGDSANRMTERCVEGAWVQWSECVPMEGGAHAAVCGDAVCANSENCTTCSADCGCRCGDGICTALEHCMSCDADCACECGDGICSGDENCTTCAQDCTCHCGDGVCTDGENCGLCLADCTCFCGDGACTTGEDCTSCPEDCTCGCGDGLCTDGEDCGTCARDCECRCGDGLCTEGEDCVACEQDCPCRCGDGQCTEGEDCITCATECACRCGDGVCTEGESCEACGGDCGVCPLECELDAFDADYCGSDACGPCGHGEGNCDGNLECSGTLTCVSDIGDLFGSSQSEDDVCVDFNLWGLPPDHRHYCRAYACGEGAGDCDSDAECSADLVCLELGTVDRCYPSGHCPFAEGDGDYCTYCGPCAQGEGDCDNQAECASGLVCKEEGSVDRCRPACDPSAGVGLCEPWTLESWGYRKSITISQRTPSAVLSGFPLLVRLNNDASLSAHARADGRDIRFTTTTGTVLDHEVESYNAGTGSLLSWVKIPTLNTNTDTTLLMYYGNAGASSVASSSAVWSNNYRMVMHLGQTGTGATNEYADSSGNNNHGRGGGGTATQVPSRVSGKIGYGQRGDGVDDYIATNLSISGAGRLTLSGWFYPRSVRPGDGLFGQNNAAETGFYWEDRINVWCPGIAGSDLCPGKTIVSACSPDFALGKWTHMAAVWNGSTLRLYINGVLKHSVAVSSVGTSGFAVNLLGQVYYSTGGHFDGHVDEVRVALTDRSSDWVAIDFATQNDPASSYSLSVEQAKP